MKSFIHWILIAFCFFVPQQIHAQKLAAIPYVSGINLPIDLKHCGDDRLFIADRAGRIRVINADGTLRPTPFLNITSKMPPSTARKVF